MTRGTRITTLALVALAGVGVRSAPAGEGGKIPVAWGEPRDGFRAGLAFTEPRTSYRAGERVGFRLYLKNVQAKAVTLSLRRASLWLASLNAQNELHLHPLDSGAESLTLGPGEERPVPGEAGTFLVQSWDHAGDAGETVLRLAPGKFRVECRDGLWVPDRDDPNRATGLRARPGALALEVLPVGGKEEGPMPPGPAVQDGVTWGRPVNGLQLGLRLKDGQHRYNHGDSVSLDLLARNASDRTLAFSCLTSTEGWPGNTPVVQNEKGEHIPIEVVFLTGFRPLLPQTLKAGETLVVGHPGFTVEAPMEGREATLTPVLEAKPGRYRVSLYESLRPSGSRTFDLLLASGTVELEVGGRDGQCVAAGIRD